ncbi:outer membrane beta-barrel protein [Kordia sp. YSTF-M3]|uniref:Outer membrane beta-barrel protein n=1 Tax=Kordia aestuariivivens TaxID=2759037 RepID=A0ABR7QGC7_9FLAO|nr:outer membrane beta-barrel protein [Kordia aestuariivivens]MBC8757627.1 outer membrane beta-barrel protein [Kordia aestuariivivens]
MILILYLLFFVTIAVGQNTSYEIKGMVSGVMDSIPLESATIYLQNSKDNSLITYTTSNRKGEFSLSGKTSQKNATLFISYVGSKTYSKKITLQAKINLKSIYLENSSMLDAVMIESRAPVTIKQDTLEFDPNSFKTKRNATVEDFIKKLPGAQVDNDGNITVNGKKVDKILVNGKPFFANDPTIATHNLTKEIIEKLQITDSKTNSEAFTGETGDSNYKTINLVIKEENNKGSFGKLSTGVGDNDRYEFSGNYNKFNNNRNVSLIGTGNNINAPRVGFGTKGIRTSRKGGITYADELFKNQSLSVNYLYSETQFENRRIQETEYIVPDAPYFSNATSNSQVDDKQHAVDLQYEATIGTTFHIDLISNFTYLPGESSFSSASETLDEFQELTNTSSINSNSTETQKEFTNALNLTKKIGDKGAFLKLRLNQSSTDFESDDFTTSELLFLNSSTEDIIRNQFTNTDDQSNTMNAGLTFRLPILAKKLFIDFKYDSYNRKEESDKAVFDFDTGQQTFDELNTILSSDFTYRNNAMIPSLRINYKNKKIKAFFNFDYAFRTLENQDRLRPELDIKRRFEIATYSAGFRYRFSKKTVVNSGIGLTNMIPSLSQLQSFTNVSDPLNIIRGNPNLKPQNRYSIHVDFRTNNFQKGFGLYSRLKADFDNNRVVSRYTINDDLVRETTYVNVDGNYGYHSYFNIYKKIKFDEVRVMRINLNSSISTTKRINFNNDIRYDVKTTNYSPSLGFDFEWENAFDFNMDYNWNYIRTNASIEGFNDEEIITHELNFYTATQLFRNLSWENKVRYIYNPNVSNGFDKYAWSWNSSLTFSFLNDSANLSLKVYDLLNQNINTRRIVSTDFIQNTQSLVLRRFVMLSLDWKFNSFKRRPKPK